MSDQRLDMADDLPHSSSSDELVAVGGVAVGDVEFELDVAGTSTRSLRPSSARRSRLLRHRRAQRRMESPSPPASSGRRSEPPSLRPRRRSSADKSKRLLILEERNCLTNSTTAQSVKGKRERLMSRWRTAKFFSHVPKSRAASDGLQMPTWENVRPTQSRALITFAH